VTIQKEVLDRLLLAKSILSHHRVSAAENLHAFSVAKDLLNAHDAADLVFAAIADQQGKLTAKTRSPSMLQSLEQIDTSSEKQAGYFKRLNDARNALKHAGNLPNTVQWRSVAFECFEKLSELCAATLGVSLEEVDESDLLVHPEVKAHIQAAKLASKSDNHRLALEELARALYSSFEASHDWWEIKVGCPNAEDAMRLSALGIPPNDFLKLQDFLPSLRHVSLKEVEICWKQSELGHPGNWRKDSVEFCMDVCTRAAVCIQHAPRTPVSIPFTALYNYQVTAKKDNVEVWEDVVEGHLEHVSGQGSDLRPMRSRKRFLKKGESIIVSPHVRHFVTEDLSPEGGPIRRVRVSHDPLSALFPDYEMAQFVNRSEVEITCIPSGAGLELFPTLKSMPWIDDSSTEY